MLHGLPSIIAICLSTFQDEEEVDIYENYLLLSKIVLFSARIDTHSI